MELLRLRWMTSMMNQIFPSNTNDMETLTHTARPLPLPTCSPSAYGPPKSKTPRTDAALDKDWTILDESLENVAKVSKQLETENGELFMAGYSARYILEDLNNEPGMWQMAKLTGLPMGVIASAFENIFAGQSSENAGVLAHADKELTDQ